MYRELYVDCKVCVYVYILADDFVKLCESCKSCMCVWMGVGYTSFIYLIFEKTNNIVRHSKLLW